MADLIISKVFTSKYEDCEIGPFSQAVTFLFNIFQDKALPGGYAALQCSIGDSARPYWEDFDRRALPAIGGHIENVYGIRFKLFPGTTKPVTVDIELDTKTDPKISMAGLPGGTLDAGGAFTPFSAGGAVDVQVFNVAGVFNWTNPGLSSTYVLVRGS